MTITLNHTIVWAREKEGAARFFAEIFGLGASRVQVVTLRRCASTTH